MFQIYRSGNKTTQEVIEQNIFTSEDWNLEYLTFPSLEQTGLVKHLVSTRLGGVSKNELGTMNLSFTRGDAEENVLENYRRIAAVLGCGLDDFVASHQTHTTNIRRVTAEDRGKGVTAIRDYEDIDGLMTDVPGLALVTYYADCVPLFFVDVKNNAIGLAHSGWRGTVDRMGKCMVKSLQEAFGSEAKDIHTAIGPSICRDCYEVSEDVAERFIAEFGNQVVTPGKAQGKYQLDLWLANKLVLLDAGILEENIAVTDICTCHNPEYLFSHRASNGKRGNLGAFLMLE